MTREDQARLEKLESGVRDLGEEMRAVTSAIIVLGQLLNVTVEALAPTPGAAQNLRTRLSRGAAPVLEHEDGVLTLILSELLRERAPPRFD